MCCIDVCRYRQFLLLLLLPPLLAVVVALVVRVVVAVVVGVLELVLVAVANRKVGCWSCSLAVGT